MSLYERCLRPLAFRVEPESAHELAVGALAAAGRVPGAVALVRSLFGRRYPGLSVRVAGLSFPNPVGLAAGFDKDCRLASVLPALGFGFIELGTVTPQPQEGNPRPRLWRIPESAALLNRLGFNNAGAAAAALRLKALKTRSIPVGINLGINADVPEDSAPREYADVLRRMLPYGDYFAVNVSSPNTSGLRALQDRLRLERILESMREVPGLNKPVFVKLSPDLPRAQLEALSPVLLRLADGAIACNTTVEKEGLPERWGDLRGGVSGAPLRRRSTRMISELYRLTHGKLPIIGVGGVFCAEDAYQKIRAGASLVQVYTGLIYRGPGLVREINRGLVRILSEHGLNSPSEAVGLGNAAEDRPSCERAP